MRELKERQEETLRSKTRELERNLEMEKLRVRELEGDNKKLHNEIHGVRGYLQEKEPVMREMQGWLKEQKYQ